MVTRESLEKTIAKYKEETARLAQETDVDKARIRMFRKRLKRAQRKLSSLVRNEEHLAAAADKSKKKAKAETRAAEEAKAPVEQEAATGAPAVEKDESDKKDSGKGRSSEEKA